MTKDAKPRNTTRRRPEESGSQEWAAILELRREVGRLRRANELRRPRGPSLVGRRSSASERRRKGALRSRQRQRRIGLLIGAGAVVIILTATTSGVFGNTDSYSLPSGGALARLSVRGRIAAIAGSQIGYSTDPSSSYCNKFSAYWDAGTADCPGGETSEEWCADFAAWAWHDAGVRFAYGYGPGEINAAAVSFYRWGLANGHWHPATSRYRAAPGDVAVYGLWLGADPSAAHVAIVTDDPPGQRGPDVINGDGDRTGFSVVETGTDQTRADAGREDHATLSGYVSPT